MSIYLKSPADFYNSKTRGVVRTQTFIENSLGHNQRPNSRFLYDHLHHQSQLQGLALLLSPSLYRSEDDCIKGFWGNQVHTTEVDMSKQSKFK